MAQVWKATSRPVWQNKGRTWKSFLTVDVRRFDNRTSAEVAQVVEHGTENAGVDSSSLSLGTIKSWYRFRNRTQYRAEVAQW